MLKYFIILLILIVAGVIARLSFFTVNPMEYVYVTQLGKHTATYDGDVNADAGLHWGWPWPVQSVQRLDRRLQQVDLPSMEVVTHGKKEGPDGQMRVHQEDRLLVEAYVCWRIAGKESVDRFVRRLGAIKEAEIDIGQKINSQLGGLIQQKSTRDFINTDAAVVENSLNNIRTELLARLSPVFDKEYGVELVDVRLRRFSYSPQVRNDIFARIRSEREKEAQKYRSQGQKLAEDIRSNANKDSQITLAKARQKEELIKGKAEIDAIKIRNEAQSKDPEFYVFLKKLESMKQILSNDRSMLLLSTHRQIFDTLFQPPQGSAVGGHGVSAKKDKGANGDDVKTPGGK